MWTVRDLVATKRFKIHEVWQSLIVPFRFSFNTRPFSESANVTSTSSSEADLDLDRA